MRAAMLALLVGTLAACAPRPAPTPVAMAAPAEATPVNRHRAQVFGMSYSMLRKAQDCGDPDLRLAAHGQRRRIEAWYRAAIRRQDGTQDIFEAEARRVAVNLGPGRPPPRACDAMKSMLRQNEPLLADAGV